MIKFINLFVFILFSSFLLQACKKDLVFEVVDTSCNLHTSSHPDHQKYQDIIEEYALKGIPGLSVVISKPEEDLWSGSAGFASIENNIKMTPCHLHHTASLVKSFIAVITLQLIEEGKLSLDSKIENYLSNKVQSYTPNIENLTIEHLLQQTSGIPDIFGVKFITQLMNDPTRVYSREELLSLNDGVKALHKPGEKHIYSDHNYMLLSMIIDELEENHITALTERIIKPLLLEDVYYHDEEYPYVEGVSASYWEQYEDGKVENISDLQNLLTSYIIGSDGIIASPRSMTKFYQSVFNGELIKAPSLDIIKSNWVKETEENRMNTAYSHGFMIIESADGHWIGHAGLQIGSSCYVFHNLDTKATIGVFTNAGTFISEQKKELIYSELWDDLREAVN